MTPEPSTNDYLADILSELQEVRRLLEESRNENKTEMGYAVFRYDTNEQASSGWMTSHDVAWAAAQKYARSTGNQYVVRSAEEEHDRKMQVYLNSIGR